MKLLKILARIAAAAVLLAALYLGGVIALGALTDYRPADVVPLIVRPGGAPAALGEGELTLLSWNIGYGGLGAEMDFFFDGGKLVRPSPAQAETFRRGILDRLASEAGADFILLQEVDKSSSRTGRRDQTELIASALPGYASAFACNYKVLFNPIPFTNPLGRIEAGQMTLSKAAPAVAERRAYHSAFSWPKQLFMLDRCFLLSRFRMHDGKELVLLNNHNSAYDEKGRLRRIEMPLIRDLMLAEYAKGNYVIAGGDWNANPPDFDPARAAGGPFPVVAGNEMETGLFPPGWTAAYDPAYPSNRDVGAPIKPGATATTVIDFYIVSPNIRVVEVKARRLDFAFSDHNPVYLKIALAGE